ncbi:phytanoyl-CoA dioxygenase family protein [Streptomyces sp. NBC_00539]|uniref:phytanoyl-CoA dioxygenase family protein n=1 Tax=Streptomyces sp. NBC_00539 TaxID=2975770 RepID=UPI002E819CFE|nr:phytanoyl-CoA dioxygenase family protein [Streptomyces sp. NBC_00539]WUC63578.1 phytanoyl-CoA dioxygenase family protein [Streptomyces sp. NBC_00539]
MSTSTVIGGTRSELKSAYERDGSCALPYRFDDASVELLRRRVADISGRRRPEVVHEKDSDVVRAIHGCHEFDDVCAALVRHPMLVEIAETLIGGPVYVYQFKVNLKQAREGAAWPWHQDYAFWSEEDAMPRPDAVNFAIPLDDVHEENGPLVVIPGSHTMGLFDLPDKSADTASDWRRHVSNDLAYTVDEARAQRLIAENGTSTILGGAGSLHAFHPSIVHSSSNNRSADRRALLLITYNAVANAPANPTRPAFLVGRDTTPITGCHDERLGLLPVSDPA